MVRTMSVLGGKADIGQGAKGQIVLSGKRELPLENLPMLVRCRDIQVLLCSVASHPVGRARELDAKK
jgi:hypothetical protein